MDNKNKDEPSGYVCALSSDFGCTDSKVMNLKNAYKMKVLAISGPTYGNELNIQP